MKKYVLVIVIAIAFFVASWWIVDLIHSAPEYETVNMTFSGTFIDGRTGEKQPITFTLKAEIYEDEVVATFSAPENNEWKFFNSADPATIDKDLDVPYMIVPCYFYNKQSGQIDFGDFALSLDQQIIAVRWLHEPYHTIYGSVAGDYTLEEMMEYFSEFVRAFGSPE